MLRISADHLLLWSFMILVSSVHSDGLDLYEVVRPIRLHDLHKRSLESTRPDTVKYAMNVSGKHIEMHLEKNTDFITDGYTETHYMSDGTPVVTKPVEMDLCYYQGKIMNDRNSMVSVSTCDGLRGYFQTAEQRFIIEPLSEDTDGDHVVMKYEDVIDSPSVCGVTNTTWHPVPEGFPGSSVDRSNARMSYLELDNNITKVRQKIFDILNFVNVVYKPLNTFIALIGLEIWTDADKIAVTVSPGDTLKAFTKWRNEDLMKRIKHDNAHLITEIDFDGMTIGLAFVSTLCTEFSTGVTQNHNTRAIAVGATLAHEMGHNLGMGHDNSSCACAGETCIMAAYLSYNIPQLFSTCSLANYEQFLNSRSPECLLNKPQAKDLLQPAVCGNGFRETGEDCDCGSELECTNPCCNATTCTLTKGSECAEGECCQNCKIADTSLLCRPMRDECDLPEYCTGNSSSCPEDFFAVNGLPCKDSTGYCYNGQCPKRAEQCIKMWGSGAIVGVDNCYNQNTKGQYFAYCTRPSNYQFIGCQIQDVMCGKLFCDKGQANPNYGRYFPLPQGNCKATFYSDSTQDFGQVDTGTKCGEEKVCSKNRCVSLDIAYNATNCTAECGKNRVCNHKLQCTCAPNLLPRDCVMLTSRSQSTDTSIAVAVFLLLGAVLVWPSTV
ncbi:zinc metalloproteinase-disintegrin-like brevilysin H2a isoform X2 [Hemibagrus wyckioides]|uniref:zinc metalloproteinase-disintegrin-like brevilysin H2a isoform X2 n=1 Tax=Hemibagrus wyckioides TaxID=337641 RepID=UPI00266C246D|nr:zinc metalloproteinase-disintegrin-like brevilysin H2a isoform X2 [Hemibagrus wyckioides]